jgi:glutamate synthase domain-containing protein 3
MSGGVAYVMDENGDFGRHRCNLEMVELEDVSADGDEQELRTMIERHFRHTESNVAKRILADWDNVLSKFVKVMPVDYKRALAQLEKKETRREEVVS